MTCSVVVLGVVVVVLVVVVVVVVVVVEAASALPLLVSCVGMRLVSQYSGVWMHLMIWFLRMACRPSSSSDLAGVVEAGVVVVGVGVVVCPGLGEVA